MGTTSAMEEQSADAHPPSHKCYGETRNAMADKSEDGQPFDLGYVLKECQDRMMSKLDCKSFASLREVCHLFQEICDAMPLKYLGVDFCDAAEHRNKNLIDRFIAQPDWLFERGVAEEVFAQQEGGIKIFKRPLNCGLQRFLGDCSLYCVNRSDETVRCFWVWNSPEMFENMPQASHFTYINIEECDDTINMASETYIKCIKHNLRFGKKAGLFKAFSDSWILQNERSSGFFGLFLSDSLLAENFIKKFGMFMMLILAAQKNSTVVVHSIFDNLTVPPSWINDIMEQGGRRIYNVPFYIDYLVYDVLARALELQSSQNNEC